MTTTTVPIGAVNCWLVAPDDGATAFACGCVRTCALNGASINRFEETDPKAKPVGVGQYANGLPFPVWDAADIRTDEGDRLLPDNASRHHRNGDDYESGGAVPDTAMPTCQPDPDDTSTRQEVFQFGVLHACDAIQPHTAFGYTERPRHPARHPRAERRYRDGAGMAANRITHCGRRVLPGTVARVRHAGGLRRRELHRASGQRSTRRPAHRMR